MPLIKRMIEPTELSRAHIGQGIRNELECVTNNTLANVIRQLSSLSKHAEDMFGELTKEATTIFHRAHNLQDRLDKLRVKVTQLDSTVAVVSLQDIHMRKPFKSSVIREQQIISKDTRPAAIQESYEKCEAPPALSKLNVYREDGKDSMKFYTDSTYFFELWRQEMEKDTEVQRQEINKRKADKKLKRPATRAPVHIKEVARKDYSHMGKGVEFDTRSQVAHQRHPMANSHHINDVNDAGGKGTNDRPNALALPQHGDYITPNHGQGGAPQMQQGGGAMSNHVAQGQGHGQYQNHTSALQQNGPVHNTVDPHLAGLRQNQNMTQHANTRIVDNHSDANSYTDRSSSASPVKQGIRGSVSNVNSPARPMAPPPLPPGPGSPDMGRNTLPPPPPPPPGGDDMHNSPQHSTHENTPSPQLDGSVTPGSAVLPPPPPPPIYTDDSLSNMPPPPPSPPSVHNSPPAVIGGHPAAMGGGMGVGGVPPPPPPPPPDVTAKQAPPAQNSPAVRKKPVVDVPEPQDGRSDLLEAIRRGIQLRQVQQKQDQDQRRKSTSKLDVQSIMEQAFEMRRRAMEENDSEEEDGEESDGGDDWD